MIPICDDDAAYVRAMPIAVIGIVDIALVVIREVPLTAPFPFTRKDCRACTTRISVSTSASRRRICRVGNCTGGSGLGILREEGAIWLTTISFWMGGSGLGIL